MVYTISQMFEIMKIFNEDDNCFSQKSLIYTKVTFILFKIK